MYGRDDVMRDPYRHYNEMFHPDGDPGPLPTLPDLDASWPVPHRVPSDVQLAFAKRQRLRSFEIACTLMAGELAATPAMPSL